MATLEEHRRSMSSGTTTPTVLEEDSSLPRPPTRTLEEAPDETSLKPPTTESTLLQWPSRKLEGGSAKPLEVSLNILSILMAAVIVAYIWFLMRYNRQEIKSLPPMWGFVSEFSQLGPTLVPLMFAFVVGRTIRSLAHWRLQQGERIGFLDSLFGSTTMTGTVTTMIDSRRIHIAGLILILVWSLSPIGGQATLRVLIRKPDWNEFNTTFPYFQYNTTIPYHYIELVNGYQIPVNTLFFGSIGAPDQVKNSSLDTWGNIKIPMIEHFPNYSPTDNNVWLPVDENPGSITYASLLGVPVGKVPEQQNSTFILETSYLTMDCVFQNFTGNVSTAIMKECKPDMEEKSCHSQFNWGAMGFNGDHRQAECNDRIGNTTRLFHYAFGGRTLANCTLKTSYVKIDVECLGWNCRPRFMCRADVPERATVTGTFFNKFGICHAGNPATPERFFDLLRTVSDPPSNSVPAEYDITELYLVNPDFGLNASSLGEIPSSHTLTEDLFSIRLAQLLNTYWMAIIGAEALYLGHPKDYNNIFAKEAVAFSEAQATIRSEKMIILYDVVWMVFLIVSVVVLLLAAIAGLVLDLRIQVPRLLMNVSTLTRGNPNFGVPTGGGALPDEARAKLLVGLEVRFGDVETEDGATDLVIGDCVENGGRVSRRGNGVLLF